MKTVGENIRQLRYNHQMTQEQLSERLYMTRQTLSNYEIGKRIPDIYTVAEIADVFGVSVDYMLGRTMK